MRKEIQINRRTTEMKAQPYIPLLKKCEFCKFETSEIFDFYGFRLCFSCLAWVKRYLLLRRYDPSKSFYCGHHKYRKLSVSETHDLVQEAFRDFRRWFSGKKELEKE